MAMSLEGPATEAKYEKGSKQAEDVTKGDIEISASCLCGGKIKGAFVTMVHLQKQQDRVLPKWAVGRGNFSRG